MTSDQSESQPIDLTKLNNVSRFRPNKRVERKFTKPHWSLVTGYWLLILLVASTVRFYRIDHQSFWNDEGNSARLSERTIPLIIEGTASDVHPPGYYLILRGWRELVGESEFGLRSFSAFVGIITVAGTIALGRHFLPPMAAGTAGLLVALSPPLVYYSQEARMYSLLGAIAVLATLTLLKTEGGRKKDEKDKGERVKGKNGNLSHVSVERGAISAFSLHPSSLFTYCFLTTLGLYTHYAYPAIIVTHGIYLGISALGDERWTGRNSSFSLHLSSFIARLWYKMGAWMLSVMLAVGLYSPWIPIFLRTGTSSGTREAGSRSFVAFLNGVSAWLTAGPFADLLPAWRPLWGWLPLLLGIGSLLGFLLRDWLNFLNGRKSAAASSADVDKMTDAQYPTSVELAHVELNTSQPGYRPTVRPAYLLLSWLIGMPLLMYSVGATDSNYLKFLTTVVPAVWLSVLYSFQLVLWWTFPAGRSWIRWLAPLIFIPVPLAYVGIGLYQQTFNPITFRADYRGMVAQIESEGYEYAGIVLNAPNQWEVFTYYYDGSATVYPYPRQKEPAAEISGTVEEMLAAHERIYALFWGFEGFDPERVVERTLDAQAFKAVDEWRGDVRFVSYAVPAEPPTEPNQMFEFDFGESGISLSGVALASRDLRPGEIVQLTLFWEATQEIEGRYKVFIHILDENGQLVAQRDSEPVGNLKPTDQWVTGETIIDNHGVLLPVDLPTGEYQLLFGLYDFFDPAVRLAVGEEDAVRLGVVTLDRIVNQD